MPRIPEYGAPRWYTAARQLVDWCGHTDDAEWLTNSEFSDTYWGGLSDPSPDPELFVRWTLQALYHYSVDRKDYDKPCRLEGVILDCLTLLTHTDRTKLLDALTIKRAFDGTVVGPLTVALSWVDMTRAMERLLTMLDGSDGLNGIIDMRGREDMSALDVAMYQNCSERMCHLLGRFGAAVKPDSDFAVKQSLTGMTTAGQRDCMVSYLSGYLLYTQKTVAESDLSDCEAVLEPSGCMIQ